MENKRLLFIDDEIYKEIDLDCIKSKLSILLEEYAIVMPIDKITKIKEAILNRYLKKSFILKYFSYIPLKYGYNFDIQIKKELKKLLKKENFIDLKSYMENLKIDKTNYINSFFDKINPFYITYDIDEEYLIENIKQRMKDITSYNEETYNLFYIWEMLLNSYELKNCNLSIYTKNKHFLKAFDNQILQNEWNEKQNGKLNLFIQDILSYNSDEYFYKMIAYYNNKYSTEWNSVHVKRANEIIEILKKIYIDTSEYNIPIPDSSYIKELFYILNKNIHYIKEIMYSNINFFCIYFFDYCNLLKKKETMKSKFYYYMRTNL